jgi:hypothetical protein
MLEYEISGKKSRVKSGDVLFVPAGEPCTTTNIGSENGTELATYVVERASRASHWLSERADEGESS